MGGEDGKIKTADMKSIDFPGATLKIGASQTDIYNVLHAMLIPSAEGEMIMCFELTDEELEIISKTKRIYYHRLTFGNLSHCEKCGHLQQNGFQPMRLAAELGDNIELIP
jgi:hypothetical protein